MKHRQLSPRDGHRHLRPALALTLSVAALLALAGRANALVTLLENFEEATGSVVLPNTTDLSIAPNPGSLTSLRKSDDASLLAGLGPNGGTQALYAYNNVVAYPIEIIFQPATFLKHGVATFSWDIMEHGPFAAGQESLEVVASGGGSTLDLIMWTPGSPGPLFTGTHSFGSSSQVLQDTPYQVRLELNLDRGTYDVFLTNLATPSTVQLASNLAVGTAGFNSAGINSLRLELGWGSVSPNGWGFAQTLGNGAYIALDNFTLEQVPEPSIMMLFGIGTGLVWLRRRSLRSA